MYMHKVIAYYDSHQHKATTHTHLVGEQSKCSKEKKKVEKNTVNEMAS